MIGASISDELVVGFALGFAVGLLAGPLIRSWIAWREATTAAREADLLEDVLARLDADEAPRGPAPTGKAPRARVP